MTTEIQALQANLAVFKSRLARTKAKLSRYPQDSEEMEVRMLSQHCSWIEKQIREVEATMDAILGQPIAEVYA